MKKYKTYQQGDVGFTFTVDDIMIVPRADVKISQHCPINYKSLIIECINHGWIQLRVHQPAYEEFMEKLTNAN